MNSRHRRILNHKLAPLLPYTKISGTAKNGVMHSGPLKLLCCDIDFLNHHGGMGSRVVYATAGCMDHLPQLVEMFPMVHFDIFDIVDSETLALILHHDCRGERLATFLPM